MTMMTIAICDDMQADARKLHKQLERIVPGSEIRIFKSGELLLEELEKKRKPYDAIFVNMDSKKVDGLETIRKIREREMSVAVIFMSRSDEYYRDAFDLFAYNYLLKPVTAATLEYIMEPLKKRLNINTDERVIHFQYRARVYTLRHSQVSFITSSLHIVNFHMTDGSILQCRGKLKDFEKTVGKQHVFAMSPELYYKYGTDYRSQKWQFSDRRSCDTDFTFLQSGCSRKI